MLDNQLSAVVNICNFRAIV